MLPWLRSCIVIGLLSLVAVPVWAQRESRSLRPETRHTQAADDIHSLLQRATSRYKSGDLDGAIEVATKILSSPGQAHNKTALTIRAQSYFDKTAKNPADTTSLANAIKDYDVLITLDPRDATFVKNRGLIYVSLKQYDKAIRDFDRLTEIKPEDADAYTFKGRCYLLMTPPQDAKAVDVFTAYLSRKPNDAVAKSHRGLAYYHLKQWDNAMKDFEAAESDPALARTHPQIAAALPRLFSDAYLQKGDFPTLDSINYRYRGIARYKSAKGLPETDPEREHLLNEALTNFDKAIRLYSKDEWSFLYRGLTYRAKNDLTHAAADFEKAFVISPSFDGANQVAYIYWEQGRALLDSDPDKAFDLFDKAADFYRKAVTTADIYTSVSAIETAYYNLGVALWDKARAAEYKTKVEPDGPIYAQAAAAFEKYLQMVPNASDKDTVAEYIKQMKEKAGP